ncbi:MAG: histidine kinase [Acidobacteria bacterium]|nr:histidine kinase [Acidobacteriota bacterium]
MHRQIERLVTEMVDNGIRYADAACEFERRFLARALERSQGSITRCAELTGLHRNTLTRKITEYKLK